MDRERKDPFTLTNFLSSGVICITLSLIENRQYIAATAEDGWAALHVPSLSPLVTSAEDEILLRQLEFLAYHRIYLIPFDLRNVQGRLRTRDETVMAPARKHLKAVLCRVDQSIARWEACDSSMTCVKHLIPQKIDNRTLAEIYSDLPSPALDPDFAGPLSSRLLAGEPIDGLRSILYPYQRRSVAAMVQKELYPGNILSPIHIPISGIDGKIFYLQPATWELLRECPSVAQNRGGMLCEELGTGKTVMILALILATLDQLSSPEESMLDTRPVLTPLALKHFPSKQYCEARRRASLYKLTSLDSADVRVPSLLEAMVHYIRVFPDGLDLKAHEEELQDHYLWEPITLNTPFYHHYDLSAPTTNRTRRNCSDTPPRIVYLTSATLIIVPVNLLSQWESEINKHCDPHSSLRVLVLQKEVEIPSAKIMASNYDVILITHTRFSLAAKMDDVQRLHTWKACSCPNYLDTRVRVPDCRCHADRAVSPLLQIRWKRLVLDEGHVSATVATNLTPFAKMLSVERRWIVTGTPTTNLLGLSFGQSDVEGLMDHGSDIFGDWLDTNESTQALSNDSDCENYLVPRKWTICDRQDLRKLSTMIIHFLTVPPFASDRQTFDDCVIAPLFYKDGPSPGTIQVLEQVMSTVMIRHRIGDIEKDITLPPIRQDTVFLELDSFSLKSYNALQAIFVINAVDSQRVDQDYFFHKRNARPLINALQNMSQIMFWHSDSNLYNITSHIIKGEKVMLDDPKHAEISEEDRELLHQAFIHMAAAFEDPAWKALHGYLDVFYNVHNIPQSVLQSWSPLPRAEDTARTSDIGLIHADRLLKLRDYVDRHPLATEERIAGHGLAVCEEEKRQHALYLESLRKHKRRKARDETESALEFEKELAKRLQGPHVVHDPIPLVPRMATNDESEPEESVVFIPRIKYESAQTPGSALLASSPVARAQVRYSTSSKLNYILNDVQKYAAHEKFLIFSNSPLTLAHVAEGLSLLRIKHFTYTTQLGLKEREQHVLTFETSETYRVFLMELKLGARGLNLIAASRVIFCEPVWGADVESQAIKRAHRIGQTRPITVKTLAIRSTMEEMMIARRSAVQGQSIKVSKNWTEESGMRHFIANPEFLKPGEGEPIELNIPLIDVSPSSPPTHTPPPACTSPPTSIPPQIRTSSSQEPMERNNTQSESSSAGNSYKLILEGFSDEPSPPRKRRVVRFAEVS